jgi:hypothetical protein
MASTKWHYWTECLRTFDDEDNNIIGLWKKNDVGCFIWCISSFVFHEPSNADSIVHKLPSDLEEDDLQGFPNNEISKSEILDMMCAMKSSENNDEDNVEERLTSEACELGFLYNKHRHCLCRKTEV